MWTSNAKDEFNVNNGCLPNGSLEEFNKYIYPKPVDQELRR